MKFIKTFTFFTLILILPAMACTWFTVTYVTPHLSDISYKYNCDVNITDDSGHAELSCKKERHDATIKAFGDAIANYERLGEFGKPTFGFFRFNLTVTNSTTALISSTDPPRNEKFDFICRGNNVPYNSKLIAYRSQRLSDLQAKFESDVLPLLDDCHFASNKSSIQIAGGALLTWEVNETYILKVNADKVTWIIAFFLWLGVVSGFLVILREPWRMVSPKIKETSTS